MSLFDPIDVGAMRLNNRIVMAPMTRARNPDNIAGPLNVTYYGQRASAGLIVTEGVFISAEAQGSLFVPSLWTEQQARGWSTVTRAVHEAGGKIFAQLWHVGRLSHHSLQPDGDKPFSASAVPVAKTSTVAAFAFAYLENGTPGRVDPTPPRAMTTSEIARMVEDFALAAERAIQAGFDGVEIHAATGYIFEQFLNPHINLRDDDYGGSIESRARIVLEVVDAIVARIGATRVAIRLSPHSTIFDMPAYPEADETYRCLAQALEQRNLAYLHLHDVGPMMSEGDALISEDLLLDLKTRFGGPTILAGGLTKGRAMDLIERGLIDLAAFGQPYMGNPDLVERLRDNHPLTTPDRDTYYGEGAEGYVDYARADETFVSASPA